MIENSAEAGLAEGIADPESAASVALEALEEAGFAGATVAVGIAVAFDAAAAVGVDVADDVAAAAAADVVVVADNVAAADVAVGVVDAVAEEALLGASVDAVDSAAC